MTKKEKKYEDQLKDGEKESIRTKWDVDKLSQRVTMKMMIDGDVVRERQNK